MFKILSNAYLLLTYTKRYIHGRYYKSTRSTSASASTLRILCCNAFQNRCDCVYTCKKLEPRDYIEKLFKCEITNKPKKPGTDDCNCELICMAKKSETQIIHENSNNDKK
jgi:hypothetical protein